MFCLSLAGWKHRPTCSSKSAVKLPTSLAAAGRRLKDCLSLTDERLHIFSSSPFFFYPVLHYSLFFSGSCSVRRDETRQQLPDSYLLWPLRPLITPLQLFLNPSCSNFSNLSDSLDTRCLNCCCHPPVSSPVFYFFFICHSSLSSSSYIFFLLVVLLHNVLLLLQAVKSHYFNLLLDWL